MATINLSYGSQNSLRVINVQYEDATHVALGGSISSTVIPSGLSAGAIFYTQTIGTDQWKLAVSDSYPYFTVTHFTVPLPPCDLNISSVQVTNVNGAVLGSALIFGSGSGDLRFQVLGVGSPSTSALVSNLPNGNYTARVSRTEDGCHFDKTFVIGGDPGGGPGGSDVDIYTYGSALFLKTVEVKYNRVTHQIVSGRILTTVIPSGLVAGIEFARQTVGTDYWKLVVSNSDPYGVVVQGSATIQCDLAIGTIELTPQKNGVNGIASVTSAGTGTLQWNLLGQAKQNTNTFFNLQPGTYTVYLTRLEDSCSTSKSFTILSIPDLVVNTTPQNATTYGGDDGAVTVSLQGSGAYTFSWLTGQTTQNISGVVAGTYQITVTDLTTGQIAIAYGVVSQPPFVPIDPEVPTVPEYGTILELSLFNSFKFVKESTINCQNPQQLDNVLFCKQYHPGHTQSNYFYKVANCDEMPFQFKSNYGGHSIELINYRSNLRQQIVPPVLKLSYAGVATQKAIRLQRQPSTTQTRVYLTVGEFSSRIKKGDVFSIVDNADGFNGSYEIVGIYLDLTLNVKYLLINKNYAIVPNSSFANALFNDSPASYNVYECSIPFASVPEGEYFIRVTAASANLEIAVSEPLDIRAEHEDTLTLRYHNNDNSFGMIWTTGIECLVRIPAVLMEENPGGEQYVTRDANYQLVKVDAQETRVLTLKLYNLPPYFWPLLNKVFKSDFFSLNDEEFQTEAALDKPNYRERFKLADSQIEIEKVIPDNENNSDDVGSITDDSLWVDENGGFFKI